MGSVQPGDRGQGADPGDAGPGLLRARVALGLRGEQPDLELMLGHHHRQVVETLSRQEFDLIQILWNQDSILFCLFGHRIKKINRCFPHFLGIDPAPVHDNSNNQRIKYIQQGYTFLSDHTHVSKGGRDGWVERLQAIN